MVELYTQTHHTHSMDSEVKMTFLILPPRNLPSATFNVKKDVRVM